MLKWKATNKLLPSSHPTIILCHLGFCRSPCRTISTVIGSPPSEFEGYLSPPLSVYLLHLDFMYHHQPRSLPKIHQRRLEQRVYAKWHQLWQSKFSYDAGVYGQLVFDASSAASSKAYHNIFLMAQGSWSLTTSNASLSQRPALQQDMIRQLWMAYK